MNKLNYLFIAIVTILQAGCSLNGHRSDDEPQKSTWVSLGFKVKESYVAPGLVLTRSEESNIKTIDIAIFEAEGASSGNFVKKVSGTGGDITPFTIPIGKKYILVFVNAKGQLSDLVNSINETSTFASIKQSFIQLGGNGILDYADLSGGGSFALTNYDPDVVYDPGNFSSPDAAKSNPIQIQVERIVSKVEVSLDDKIYQEGIFNKGTVEEVKFLLNTTNKSSYVFGNPNDDETVFYDKNFSSPPATDFETLINPDWATAPTVVVPTSTVPNAYSAPLYCLENTTQFSDQRDNVVTHIIVRVQFTPSGSGFVKGQDFWVKNGIFYNNGSNGGVCYTNGYMYYRIFFKHDTRSSGYIQDMLYAALRNKWYQVNISKFKEIGSNSYLKPNGDAITADIYASISVVIKDWGFISQNVEC